jgi:hypothetical protein
VILRISGDSLGSGTASWVARARAHGVECVPDFLLQNRTRQHALPAARRYTWGSGQTDPEAGCPLDSVFWRRCLLDRAEEILATLPEIRRLAVDLEFATGPPKHYDVGPCRCSACLAEYTGTSDPDRGGSRAWRLSGLLTWEEARLGEILAALLGEFAARHPGVELGVFDLDLDSFVHRAMARALARCGVPAADYCERSYSVAGGPLRGARARLRALGLTEAPLIGGLWLKRFASSNVPAALRSITERADGYFVFTTYSLSRDPATLSGPYTLLGSPADYWRALTEVNALP